MTRFRLRLLALTLLAPACGDATGTGGGGTAVVASVRVTPASAQIAPGGQVAFTATVLDAAGAAIVGRAVDWSVSNGAVAGISTGGMVTGIAPGGSDVVATVEGKTGQGSVVVSTTALPSVADDFERANGPLGSSWLDQFDNLEIDNGEVGMKTLAGSSLARWQADSFGADQWAEVVVGSLGGNQFDFFRGLQVFVRQQQSGTAWRWGFHYFSDNNTYGIKYDGGPTPQTRTWETGPEPLPVPGDVLRIEAVGDTIRGYLNGQLKVQVIDGALNGGAMGFVVGLNPGATTLPRGVVAAWSGGER
jgi:hypothetical protein